MDLEARRALAEPPPPGQQPTAEKAISRAAYIEFMADYDMPHLQPRVPPEAARELLDDYTAGRLPAWALRAIRLREIRASAQRVRRDGET